MIGCATEYVRARLPYNNKKSRIDVYILKKHRLLDNKKKKIASRCVKCCQLGDGRERERLYDVWEQLIEHGCFFPPTRAEV